MNLRPLLHQLSIVDTKSRLVPFRLNWAQEEYLAEVHRQHGERKPVRIIVLKARQLGISTLTEGIMFLWCMMHHRTRSLVIAHDVDSGQHLLSITENYWETYPFKQLYTNKYKSKNELSWVENHSAMKVQTAANTKAGRSKTLTSMHASEVAFWEKAQTTMLGLNQALHPEPNTFACIESTANGVGGFFYDQWNAAVQGEIEYVPLFFPWWRHPQYSWSHITHNDPPPLGKLDDEERVLRRVGVDDDHLAWRRWAIKNLTNSSLEDFHQEYPSTPEEAFITTGTNIFPIGHLADEAVYQPFAPTIGRLVRQGARVEFVPDITGPLRVYRTPSRDRDWGVYMVAGDPTRYTMGDFACIQVINRITWEQCAVWRGKIDPNSFAEEIAKLGIYYNTAVVTCEVEGPGYSTVGALVQMSYPKIWRHHWADKDPTKVGTQYGWSTNHQRKQWAIGMLLKLVVDHSIVIHDKQTFIEMREYITLPGGEMGPSSKDGYDDTVTSLAIACICSATEGPVAYTPDLGMGEDRAPSWQSWGEQVG